MSNSIIWAPNKELNGDDHGRDSEVPNCLSRTRNHAQKAHFKAHSGVLSAEEPEIRVPHALTEETRESEN